MFKNFLWIPIAILAATAGLAVGCGESDDTGDEVQKCLGGAMQTCTCEDFDDLESTQVCSEITETWGECQCDFARVRFCHSLAYVDPITQELDSEAVYTLSFSNSSDDFLLAAVTGECDTPVGEPCEIVPAGLFSMELANQDGVQYAPEGLVEFEAGESYAFKFDITTELIVSFGEFPLTTGPPPSGFGTFATDTCPAFTN